MTVTSAQLLKPLEAKKVKTLLRVARLAGQHGLPFLLVGAFARDIHFWHIYGIEPPRKTHDIDISIQLGSWDEFHTFSAQLRTEGFLSPETDHPEKFLDQETGQEVDILPFGKISENGATIIWPNDTHPWTITGLQDAYEHAMILLLETGATATPIRVATLANIVLLKTIAIHDRPEGRRKRDAFDIDFTIEKYLDAGQRARLKGTTGSVIMARYNNDLRRASAYLIGEDIARQTTAATHDLCATYLTHEIESSSRCYLAQQLSRGNLTTARALLAAIRDGIQRIYAPS